MTKNILDTRNIRDEFKGWTQDLIRETVKKESFPYAILMFSVLGDFNIGTFIRSGNAFGAREITLERKGMIAEAPLEHKTIAISNTCANGKS